MNCTEECGGQQYCSKSETNEGMELLLKKVYRLIHLTIEFIHSCECLIIDYQVHTKPKWRINATIYYED